MDQLPFKAIGNATLAVTATSGRIALPGTAIGGQERHMRLYNAGPSEAFFELGGSTVAATAGGVVSASPDGSTSLSVGAIEIWKLAPGDTHIAAISGGGSNSAVLRITVGEGF